MGHVWRPFLCVLVLYTCTGLENVQAQTSKKENNYGAALQVNSNPSGAAIQLLGKYTFVGRTPFVIPYQLNGKYRIKAKKEGYESKTATINLVEGGFNNITLNLSKKTRAKAALRSFLFPGWGQFYGQNKTRGFLVSTIQVAFGTVAVFAAHDYNNEKDKYERALANFDRNKFSIEEADRAFQDVTRQLNKTKDAKDFLNTALYLTAGFWFYNILDSILFFSSSSSFISVSEKNISMKTNNPENKEFTITMRFEL